MRDFRQAGESKAYQRTVLVVEDSIAERVRLVAMLAKLGYRILEAGNGLEAVICLEREQVDIVISDWRMPSMDGLTLCKKIKESSDFVPYFILLTGQKTVNDLVAAMDAGSDDFIAKPFAVEELRVRLSAGHEVIDLRHRMCEENKLLSHSLTRESESLTQQKEDLITAESVKRALLPATADLPCGVSILHYFKSANGIAGDSYNVFALSPTVIAFYVIDVMGCGIRSALLSFYASQTLLKTSTRLNEDKTFLSPSQIALELNQRLHADFDDSIHLTMVYGILNIQTGKGSFCLAGDLHPLLLGANLGMPEFLGNKGYPIGTVHEACYEDTIFELTPGHRLVIMSDGLLSCRLSPGNFLTQQHLSGLLNRITKIPKKNQQNNLTIALNKFLSTRSLNDDISLLIIERSP